MSTTIDSLDIQITTSAGQSAANIDRLANALERLRANSKLTSVTNNLNKLKTALDGLQSTSGAISGLNRLSQAMQGLSTLPKLTNFAHAIRELKKIPDVINGLDLTTLEQFRKKMEKLAKALDPLATKITAVAQGFSRLPANVRAAVSAVNGFTSANHNMSNSLNTGNLNLFTAISNYETLFQAVNSVIQAVSGFLAQAIEWDGIQFRFGRAFGEDAEETYAYIQKINEALGINIQEFMQYSSLYGSLLSGFGMAQEKVTTISVGLTELSYDIWAAYNDRFKSLEDASEAVRSAITGEIEPIRNAGIALTEASLQEFIDSTHLAGVSIEKLTEAQKSEVRYAAMVNAAMNQGIVGTYAREMNTAEGAVRSLSQSFKTLTQALGSLFIPMLQVIVPYVTAFVELLTDAVFWVAKLFGIPMQEISWGDSAKGVGGLADGAKDAASGLGSAAKEAKKLKSYTMGFDELNVIDPNSGSGSGGSGGAGAGGSGWGEGLDLDTLWDDTIFAQASKKVDELKENVLAFFEKWKTEIAIISAALGVLSVAKLLSSLGEALGWGDKFLNTMNLITKLASSAIVITLQFAVQKEFFSRFLGDDGSFWDYVTALLIGAGASWILYSMWGPGGLVIGLGVTAVASLSALIESGNVASVEGVTVALTGLASGIGAVAWGWKLLAKTDVGAFFQLLREGEPLLGSLAALFPGIANGISSIVGWFTKAATAVGGFVSGISLPVWGIIAAVIVAIASTAYFLYENWNKVTDVVKNFFNENIAPKLEEIGEHFSDIKEATGKFGEAIGEAYKTVKGFFEGIDWPKLDWIGKIFEVIGGIIFSVVGGVIATAFNILMGMIENVIQIFTGLAQITSGVVQFLVALFTGDFSSILGIVEMIAYGIQNLWNGLVGFVIDIVSDFVGGIISWFTNLWDELVGHSIVPDTINGIVEWFLSLPDKILEPLSLFCENVLQTFRDLWENTKVWWAENVAPKFTSEYWLNKFDVIRAAIKTKLDEWKKTILDKWSDIKSWYNSNVAPKFTKAYWEGKFKGFKEGFVSVIKNAMNAGIDKINSFIDKVNEALEIDWDAFTFMGAEIFPAGSFTLATIPKISRFENGGFIEDGLFTMNRGEIAGKFNNGKSVVANNEQIVAGIAEGVYSAVVAAMSETQRGGEQPVIVYLDGKQIYSSVKRTESRRGVDLMGNQVGYVY